MFVAKYYFFNTEKKNGVGVFDMISSFICQHLKVNIYEHVSAEW